MEIPYLDKRNASKVLRELDINKFTSLPQILVDIRQKLVNKQELSISEKFRLYPLLKLYFKDIKIEINNFYINHENIWDQFSHRMPMDFQKTGIEFLIKNDRCILADATGTGKSVQVIIASKLLPDNYDVLIVTTKSLQYNFFIELAYFDNRVSVVDKKWESNKYTIIRYSSLSKWKKEILDKDFQVIICDECHLLKHNKSNRSQIFLDFINKSKKGIKKVWLLTGTPIDNRPSEYYNLLRIIKHDLSKDWQKYMETYCNGYIDIYGRWNTKGASNLDDLHNKTKDIILRRLKENVLKDFPNKFRSTIWLKLENKKKYDSAIKDWKKIKHEELGSDYNPDSYSNEMTKILIWRMFCAYEKIEDGSTIDLLQNEIEKGNKIFMLTNFTKVIDYTYKKLGDKISSFIDGRIDAAERMKIIEEFNDNPEKKVLISNMAVGTIGYNIQSANIVYINDLSLKPSDMIQGEDRAWRIGQKKDVTVLYPLYKDTVEEHLYNMLIDKNKIFSKVVDGKEKDFFSQEDTSNNMSTKSILQEIFTKINSAKV